jgi:hypothetical protein
MISQAILIASALAASPVEGKCTAAAPHDATALAYICRSEKGWAESVATGDATVVKRILAEDFVGIHPSGKSYRKAEMVEGTPKAPETFASNVIGDISVRFYGNTVVAQGSETWRKKNGETGRFVWTDTWLKRNGQWQIVAAEDLIAPAEPAK